MDRINVGHYLEGVHKFCSTQLFHFRNRQISAASFECQISFTTIFNNHLVMGGY